MAVNPYSIEGEEGIRAREAAQIEFHRKAAEDQSKLMLLGAILAAYFVWSKF